MSEQNSLFVTASRATSLGNGISLKMVQFLNEVKNQPAGFRDLGLDFLGICQILNSLEETLKEYFRTNQPFPQQAIPELTRILVKTLDDFSHLEELLEKFMDFERGGTFAKLQKTWRIVFADKDIAIIGSSLQENRGALKMAMLLTNINPTLNNASPGYEYKMLATKLEHQVSGSPTHSRPIASLPPTSPAVAELPAHEIQGTVLGPPSGAPLNWNQSSLPLAERKGIADTVSTISSYDPESPSSQGILTPSVSEMSISDRVPEPSIASTINTTDEEVHAPEVEEKIAIENSTSSQKIPTVPTIAEAPPRIHINRSTLQFRVPKQTSGANNSSLNSALISAVTAQKSKIVEHLLDRGVSPDTGPEKNALCIAATKNDQESLKLLLDFGGDPNLKGADGLPSLYWACKNNYPAIAHLLLGFGADPNISIPEWSMLTWALHQSKEGIVCDLLVHGADPNLIMPNGWISLRYACDRDVKPSLISHLFKYGADPNLKDSHGDTSLCLACTKKNHGVVEILLSHGADPNLQGPDLPIKCALRSPECMKLLILAKADFKLSQGLMELAVLYNAIETVKIMLDAGVDPNEKMRNVYSPLTTSIRDNYPEITALLLSRGADPHQKGEGYPLAMAVRRPEILRILLASGADLKSYQGLMELAALANNIESINILLEAGVSVDEKHRNCYTPLTTAVRDNRPDMVAFLLDHGADPNLKGEGIPLAMALTRPAILKQLIQGGAKFTKEMGLIELATYHNNIESVKILIEAGDDINQKNRGVYTPLTTAIRDNRIEILSYLLNCGADPNTPGEGLPIINASKYADPQRLKLLLDAGADVNQTQAGRTALMAACEKGNLENVKLLIEKGADVDLVDNGGKTAMDFAVTQGNDEPVMMLLEKMG